MSLLPAKISFILDQVQLDRNDQMWLPDWLRLQGHDVIVTVKPSEATPLQSARLVAADACLLIIGSIQFTRHFKRRHEENCPGAYYSEKSYRCSQYMHQLPSEWLLNCGHVFAPWGDFSKRPEWFYDLYGKSSLFVRPDSGAKSFTGLVIERSGCEHEISALRQLARVPDDELCLICPATNVGDEYRFVICHRRVISGSRYMSDGQINVSEYVDPDCWAMAERVAAHRFQVDIAYTCDVTLSDGMPKIVELNAFSTSGLYACDPKMVYHAVIEAAWLEHMGEIALGD